MKYNPVIHFLIAIVIVCCFYFIVIGTIYIVKNIPSKIDYPSTAITLTPTSEIHGWMWDGNMISYNPYDVAVTINNSEVSFSFFRTEKEVDKQ